MNSEKKKLTINKKMIFILKIICCLIACVCFFSAFFIDGVDDYISYKDYNLQNEIGDSITADGISLIEQKFVSPGNILSNVYLYFGNSNNSEITISIADADGNSIAKKKFNMSKYNSNAWNSFAFDIDNMKRGNVYKILIAGEDLSNIVLTTNNAYTRYFGECNTGGSASQYILAFGLQITYKYWTLGYSLELVVRVLLLVSALIIMCFTILNIEEIIDCFKKTDKKNGMLYALYCAESIVMIYNPLDSIRTEVTEFGRIIGAGLSAGVDVSKRTSNFSHWFIYFSITFCLCFLCINFLKSKYKNDEAWKFLDNVIVIANVNLVLRGITYFYDKSLKNDVFYYSDSILSVIVIIGLSFIVFEYNKKIQFEELQKIIIACWLFCLPVSIYLTNELEQGRVLFGLQALVAMGVMLFVYFVRVKWENRKIQNSTGICVTFFSLIPFGTSLYIELVTILNQHEIFISEIRRYYLTAIIIGVVLTILAVVAALGKKTTIKNWKKFTYPSIIFGMSCLWCQAAIYAEYSVDKFETANSSILISDFLNYGDIPIVQHYGGHMMTGVWEGIIYALLNNDNAGAALSPYSAYIATVIAVLFYIFIKKLWNEDAALITTLFFAFYSQISYCGLGLLVVIAAMAYVRKNSYFRAAVLWLAVIWCAIYRLDSGFAFAIAGIMAMIIYVIAEKNKQAVKQLVITLVAWGIFGIILWCVLCVIKDVNPVNRLLEFLNINLSNQNWAYEGIGDTTLLKFAWAYVFVPFVMVIGTIYTIFSKKIRNNLGTGLWIGTLLIGFSYFCNFSRGLVRHSLVEGELTVPIWFAYFFLSIVLVALFNRKEIFVPAFTLFVLVNSLLLNLSNYTDSNIADLATSKVETYVSTWTLDRFANEEKVWTYWQELEEKHEIIERVQLNDEAKDFKGDFELIADTLLEDGETFVDLVNKTSVYPLIGRKNPVYVSQSPLQLSGEFTQEMFIEEIKDVPVVMMPGDTGDDRASESLDALANVTRYYKVFEYVYQNYVPLCRNGDVCVVWCLADKYDEYVNKIKNACQGVDIKDGLLSTDSLKISNVKISKNSDGTVNAVPTGTNPQICELQKLADISMFENTDMKIIVQYETDTLGRMQVYYTTEKDEVYNAQKSVAVQLENKRGIVEFTIPVTEYTHIRLDLSDDGVGQMKIGSLKLGVANFPLIDYGYDDSYIDKNGKTFEYPYLHNYPLNSLARIWAETDKLNSADNKVVTELKREDGVYKYNLDSEDYDVNGNYLKVTLTYDGVDRNGLIAADDETTSATLKVGSWFNGKFVTRYYYTFTVKEGEHDYLFRISSDYYWYLDKTNAVSLESDSKLHDISMRILEGD